VTLVVDPHHTDEQCANYSSPAMITLVALGMAPVSRSGGLSGKSCSEVLAPPLTLRLLLLLERELEYLGVEAPMGAAGSVHGRGGCRGEGTAVMLA
jgi:hypothetical protein